MHSTVFKIINKDLRIAWKTLLSTLITYVGEKSEKEKTRVWVKLSHFAVQLKLAQHCKSTILQCKIKIMWRIHFDIWQN